MLIFRKGVEQAESSTIPKLSLCPKTEAVDLTDVLGNEVSKRGLAL